MFIRCRFEAWNFSNFIFIIYLLYVFLILFYDKKINKSYIKLLIKAKIARNINIGFWKICHSNENLDCEIQREIITYHLKIFFVIIWK